MLKSIRYMAVLAFTASTVAFAEEGAQAVAATTSGRGTYDTLAAGLGIAIAVLGGALGQGKAASAALEGMSRNPAAAKQLFVPMILSLALIETLVLFAFLVTFVKIMA